jgi:hypothetical protein
MVDFLFTEVISAPTVDAMKLAAEESVMTKAVRRVSSVGLETTRKVATAGRRLSNAIAPPANRIRKSSLATLTVGTSRLIPEAISEAHVTALASAKEILNTAKQGNDNFASVRKTTRCQSAVVKQREVINARRSTRHSMIKRTTRIQPAMDVNIDTLFAEFTVDMTDQRKALPSSQHESFDEKWG